MTQQHKSDRTGLWILGAALAMFVALLVAVGWMVVAAVSSDPGETSDDTDTKPLPPSDGTTAVGTICKGHIVDDLGDTCDWLVTEAGRYKIEVLQPDAKIPIIPSLRVSDGEGRAVAGGHEVGWITHDFAPGAYKLNVRDSIVGDAKNFRGGFAFSLSVQAIGPAHVATAAPSPSDDDPARVDAPDPHRADLADLVKQARAIVRKLEGRAELTSATAFRLDSGLIDTTSPNPVNIGFEYRYHDTQKAPGADLVEGRISVRIVNGRLKAERMEGFGAPALREEAPGFLAGALPDPQCPVARAWATAVKSGVPAEAIASVLLYNNKTFSPRSPLVWSFRVEGYDDYRREIDAQTCSLVRSWAQGKGR